KLLLLVHLDPQIHAPSLVINVKLGHGTKINVTTGAVKLPVCIQGSPDFIGVEDIALPQWVQIPQLLGRKGQRAVWIGAGKLHSSLEILQSFVETNRKRHVFTKSVTPDYLRSRMSQGLEVAVVLPSAPNRILLEFFEPLGACIQLELLQIIDKFLLILGRQCDQPLKVNRIDDHHFL